MANIHEIRANAEEASEAVENLTKLVERQMAAMAQQTAMIKDLLEITRRQELRIEALLIR